MKYHIDRRVVLNEDSAFKNLYEWSLQEVDAQGTKVGRDMIPWVWALNFVATEISLVERMVLNSQDGDNSASLGLHKASYISAKMRPGNLRKGHRFDEPSYSMFGTDRTIHSFGLEIFSVGNADEKIRCTAWGSLSYTHDLDFRDETTDDALVFCLQVTPKQFDKYVEAIMAGAVDGAVLNVRRVEGFYSDWSPSITAENIKVLTKHEKDHPVETAADSKTIPPRLGNVEEATFMLIRKVLIPEPEPEVFECDGLNEYDDHGDLAPDASTGAAQISANANARIVELLASLRLVAWIAIILLFWIAVS